jgi:hypothetical protein
MSFLWSRAGATITSRCTLCSLVLASRLERDIHTGQRVHDAAACQQRRLDTARAVMAPEFDGTCLEGHERVGNTYVDTHGGLVCNACRREKYAAKRPRISSRSADSAKILDRFDSEFCDSAKILDRFSASTKEV